MNKYFDYLKKNLGIIYSLTLVIIIPVLLFFSTYYNLSQFENNFDYLLRTKGMLFQNTLASFLEGFQGTDDEIQSMVKKLAEDNPDISELRVVRFQKDESTYKIVASSVEAERGADSDDIKDYLASSLKGEGTATLEEVGGQRFWEVARFVKTANGDDLVLKIKLSLKRVDDVFARSIFRTYLVIGLTSLILILLVSNYIRLSGYLLLYNKIKEVDQMKDDFISMASHELKTPLAAITGFVSLLKESEGFSQEDKNYLEKIATSSDRLKVLVDDILNVSRLEQNRLPFKNKEVSTKAVVNKVIDGLIDQAKNKGLEIQNDLTLENDLILVDEDRFEQILVNLIGNAIKYTLKGTIRIKSEVDNGKILISIEDTGLGMSAENQKRLFEKFYRIRNSQTASISGTGLGLWITKQLVEKMNGTIEVQSIEGVGSKFIIKFPLIKKKD